VRCVEGFPFIQPSLDANKDAVTSLLLGVIISPKTIYHKGRPHVRTTTIIKWLTEYYIDCLEDSSDYKTNKDYVSQMKWLNDRLSANGNDDIIPLVDFKLPSKRTLYTTSTATTPANKTMSHVATVRSKL
jgi:hypothetical protein